jgi:phosphatidylethanolamine/phosphatidyl-N-methylethanolamine N-methyltransferase
MDLTGLRQHKPFDDIRQSGKRLIARIQAEVKQEPFLDLRLKGKRFVAKLQAEVEQERFRGLRLKGKNLVDRISAEVKQVKEDDDTRFLKTWLDKPLMTGAVSPSSKALARRMASTVDPELTGPVIELGPGTGPVTEALIARGVAEERLILVEFNPEFCALLKKRYPKAIVIEGDAYAIEQVLDDVLTRPAAACVSSLPLFTKPEIERLSLLRRAFQLMTPGAPFIQFTYATVSPMPRKAGGFESHVSPRIWMNLPPACVWTYRKT